MAAYLAVAARCSKGKTVARERRNPLEDSPDVLLIAEYRLTRKLIQDLVEMLRPKMKPKSNRGAPITVKQRVLICLKILASSSFQNCAKDYVNVSQQIASLMFDKFLNALGEKAHEYINMPPDPLKTMQDFHSIAGFPSVIGAIDGTHAAIIAPHENEHLYVCRKIYHSINVQASVSCVLIFLASQINAFDSSSRFFRRHRCQITEATKNDGFVSFTEETIECRNLSPSSFSDSICPDTCRDPITGSVLDNHYAAEAIRYHQQLYSQLDGEISFHLNASCRCVSRNHDEM